MLFMIKAPIFSQQGFNMSQARSVLESSHYLAMLSFSVIKSNLTCDTKNLIYMIQ